MGQPLFAVNCTLEQMARALFKSWFIDFDPIHAKQRGEQPEGMDAETAALFPDRFVEVDGKEVPERWAYSLLGEIIEEQTTRIRDEKSIVVLSAVSSGNLVRSDDHFNKQVYSQSLKNYKVVAYDDFAYNPSRANIGSIGRLKYRIIGAVSPIYVVFRPMQPYSAWLEFFIELQSTKNYVKQLSSGSVRQSINFESLSTIPVIVPRKEIVQKFYEEISKWQLQIQSNTLESGYLCQIRDSLLPQLLSGKLDVSDWENAVTTPEGTPA